MTTPIFECPINLQPRLVVLLPAVLLAVMIVGGWILYFATRRGLISEAAGGMLGTVLFFVMVAGVLAVALGGKGQVVVTEERLILQRGLAGEVSLPLAGAEYTLTGWRTMGGFRLWWHDAGPQLRVQNGGRTVTIASLDPPQGEGLPPSGARIMDLPTAVIDPADFLNLLETLGVQPAAAGR